jgi:hypothetical protein
MIVAYHQFILTGTLFDDGEVFGLREGVDEHGGGIRKMVLMRYLLDGMIL